MTAIEEVASFVTGLRYRDIPAKVSASAKALMLNIVGVQLASSQLPWSQIAREYGVAEGGPSQSTVVRYGDRISMANAAFVNATYAHGFELDDNHPRTSIKGGCVSVSTALAVGEACGRSGAEVLAAVVAGYEVMTGIALMARPGLAKRGNHATGTCGALGAAAVTANLLGLDEARTAYALGIAATQLTGFSELPGSGRGNVKRLFGGLAAHAGVRAALLAEAGMTTPLTTLDPGSGFARSFGASDADVQDMLTRLGQEWQIGKARIKRYAQDGYLQPVSEGLARIRAEHRFHVDEIEQVRIGVSRHACEDVVGRMREPATITDAQFSGTFSAALFLVTGGAGFTSYTQENLGDPGIAELSRRVFVEVDDEIEQEYQRTRPRGATVSVRLASGRTVHATVPDATAMTDAEVDDKFTELAGTVLHVPAVAALRVAIRGLDAVDDVSVLARMLCADADASALLADATRFTAVSEDECERPGRGLVLPDGGDAVRCVADAAPAGAFDPRALCVLSPRALGYRPSWVVHRFEHYGLPWDMTALRLNSTHPASADLPWLVLLHGGSANLYEFVIDPFNRPGLAQHLAQRANVLVVTIPGNFTYGGWAEEAAQRRPRYVLDAELSVEETDLRNAVLTNSLLVGGLAGLVSEQTDGDALIVGHSTSGELAHLALDEPQLSARMQGRFLGWASGGPAPVRRRLDEATGSRHRPVGVPQLAPLRIRHAPEFVQLGNIGPLNPCGGTGVPDERTAQRWTALTEQGRPNFKQVLQDLEHRGLSELRPDLEAQIAELNRRAGARIDLAAVAGELFAANRPRHGQFRRMVWAVGRNDGRHWYPTNPELAYELSVAGEFRKAVPQAEIRVLLFDFPITHYGHVERPRHVAAGLLAATQWLVADPAATPVVQETDR